MRGPEQCQTLIPLSTRRRGDKVAVRRERPSGDHSQKDVLGASIVHTLPRLRLSKMSNLPARLPKPASARSRPCGLNEIKLCGEAPKSCSVRTRWSNSIVLAGMSVCLKSAQCPVGSDHKTGNPHPYTTPNSFELGLHAKS
jgi:hypothetical protein